MNKDLNEKCILIKPEIFKDERGYFLETYKESNYIKYFDGQNKFAQDNLSYSKKGVLRGMHLQKKFPQGKLISVIAGNIFDVVIDLRENSPNFCKWESFNLSCDAHEQLWVPPGFAHGFLTLSDSAFVQYKCTEEYKKNDELCIFWNDNDLKIQWPLNKKDIIVSDKDANGISIANFKSQNFT